MRVNKRMSNDNNKSDESLQVVDIGSVFFHLIKGWCYASKQVVDEMRPFFIRYVVVVVSILSSKFYKCKNRAYVGFGILSGINDYLGFQSGQRDPDAVIEIEFSIPPRDQKRDETP